MTKGFGPNVEIFIAYCSFQNLRAKSVVTKTVIKFVNKIIGKVTAESYK